MSRIRTNVITNRLANGAPTVSNGLVISGVTTTSDVNVGTGVTLNVYGGATYSGIITATSFVGSGANLTGVASTENIRTNTNATFLQNINVSGTSTVGGDVNIADKIVHIGDTNTAIRFPAADTVTVETGGSERLRIDSSGRLGIGTASGTRGLNVEGTGTASRAFFNDSSNHKAVEFGADSNGSFQSTIGANPHLIYTNGTERLRITSTGLVGIGDNSPDRELVVKNASSNSSIKIEASNAHTSQLFFSDTDTENVARISVFHGSGSDQNSMLFGTAGSTRLAITSAGKFGFNNISPSAEIELTFDSGSTAPSSGTAPKGIALSYGTTDGHNAGIWFSPGFGDDQGISGISGSRVSGYQTDLRFYTNNTNSAAAFTERMRITPSGGVLINRTSATSYGNDLETKGITVQTDGDTTGMRFNRSDSNAAWVAMRFYVQESQKGYIQVNTGSVTYSTSSDYRLKENVVSISDGITRLKQLKPYRFNFKSDSSTTLDGFYAHEASEVVPESVVGTKDAVDSEGNIDPQGIDQSKIVPLLTAALQEAVTKIEVLETRLNNAGIAT